MAFPGSPNRRLKTSRQSNREGAERGTGYCWPPASVRVLAGGFQGAHSCHFFPPLPFPGGSLSDQERSVDSGEMP